MVDVEDEHHEAGMTCDACDDRSDRARDRVWQRRNGHPFGPFIFSLIIGTPKAKQYGMSSATLLLSDE